MQDVSKKIALISIVLSAFVWSACSSPVSQDDNPVRRMEVDQFDRVITAPDFSGLVVVFASWCKPCREELPKIAHLYSKGLPENIHVIALSLDEGDAKTVQRIVNDLALPFPVYHVGMPAVKRYQIVGVPTIMVVRNGDILEKTPGQQTPSQLSAKLKALGRPGS